MANNDGGDIEKTCRLCKKNVEVRGVITNTRVLFSMKTQTGKLLCKRFRDLGVVLTCRPGVLSGRICKACFSLLSRVEESISTLNKWKFDADAETNDGGADREKRERSTPIKTPRKKKLRSLNPESRVSTTEVNTTHFHAEILQ